MREVKISGYNPVAVLYKKHPEVRTNQPNSLLNVSGGTIPPDKDIDMNAQFLLGKTCLVTGGAQGVGWATAQALADYGGEVYVCDISPENIAAAQAELADSPWRGKVHFRQCDVSVRNDVEQWIADIHQETGRIDILINNAAFVRWESVSDMPIEELERMMAVGYNGMVSTIKAALPFMLRAGQGQIVNISSSAGKLFISKGDAGYAAVKAAIDGFTQTLALELQETGVRATVVRLGPVEGTDFFRKQVSSHNMPRMGDFLPALNPPQVAQGILSALRRGQAKLDMPGYLPFMYLFFSLAPGLLIKMVGMGGPSRKDYGAAQWKYQPKAK
jgi:NAD(P)-dependent dehydrogenase (short-subunit alcohol dehydrogenase family)